MFNEYAQKWGDKYVTSNVKVYNQTSGQFEYVGATHRYFTTDKGLRIMAFGVLFDFTGTLIGLDSGVEADSISRQLQRLAGH